MKKHIYHCLIFFCMVLVSCSKDLGHYNYNQINEVSISLSNAPSSVFLGDTLRVSPELTETINSNLQNYSFRWALNTGEDLSTEQNLNYKVTQSPGNYELEFYLTDKTTGVTWQQREALLINTSIYEGYLILNEVNGSSRLDMLSYRDGGFVQYTDVLGQVGSELKLTGAPIKVASLRNGGNKKDNANYNIYILTDQLATRISPETFGWTSQLELRNRFLGSVPTDFRPKNLFVSEMDNFPFFGVLVDGKFIYANLYSPFVYSLYANYYPDDPASVIPIANKAAMVGESITVYDTVKRVFMSYSNKTFQPINSAVYSYPEGKILVDLFNNNYSFDSDANGYRKSIAYAILKDPSTGVYSLLRFYIGQETNYYETINATDFDQATCFAASPELSYLFYAVGGKVYEYDMSLKTAKLMLDMGEERVSLLSFVPFYQNMDGSSNQNYSDWGKWLTVGTYNPSKPEGSNGSLRTYQVPPVNQPLVKKQEWTGFGKIVSVSYRERS